MDFRVWAPKATTVEIALDDSANSYDALRR